MILGVAAAAVTLITFAPLGHAATMTCDEPMREGKPRVIDGDTIDIGDERIRLQGVDTPERGQRCLDAAGGEYRCGRAATEALKGADRR